MCRRLALAMLLVCAAALSALAAPPQRDALIRTSESGVRHGGVVGLAKAAGDTVDLMGPTGSGAPYSGDFESGWAGWTSVDETAAPDTYWHASDFGLPPGEIAAYCGIETMPACSEFDSLGGYGNSWDDNLVYRVPVADPGANATVRVTATLRYDTEPAYDYVYVSSLLDGNVYPTTLQYWTGKDSVFVDVTTLYAPSELVDGTDIAMYFRFMSDGAFSDQDCLWPTAGACTVDDITVTVSQTGYPDLVSFTDFQDGTLGDWVAEPPQHVGDFARIWQGLGSVDPCTANSTAQVAFIDDGTVVPGTGGSDCINWCYGPGGHIVNTTGGLMGPTGHIENYVYSPEMIIPGDQYEGLTLAFDVYRHEDLSADSPGMFYRWDFRSADTDGSAGNGVQVLEEQGWQDRSFVYYGGPDYLRSVYPLSDLLEPGADVVQVRLGVAEFGWAWGWTGDDGTPAPYYDNISVKVYPFGGPGVTARDVDLAQDNFPEIDEIDMADMGRMHVRFDMAKNIAPYAHLRNDPGDSIVVRVASPRQGAVLTGPPRMHYVIDANPLFDVYRTTPTSGAVDGYEARYGATWDNESWAFDLPDTGTLFPGDVLHYYIRAEDSASGDVKVATLPADLTKFGDFSFSTTEYAPLFTVRALPSITDDGFGGYSIPRMLFWNDAGDRGGRDEWNMVWNNLGIVPGIDLDIYETNGPSSGVGNGLGGRTGGGSLVHYDDLVYTSGDLSTLTITNGDFENDPGPDQNTLNTWLAAGNKDMFLVGDHLASDLATAEGPLGAAFVADRMGLGLDPGVVKPLIGNQVAPLVRTLAGNSVFQNLTDWIAYGSCPSFRLFDAVFALPGSEQLAEFTDPFGNPGAYPYAAGTLRISANGCRTVSLPYGLATIYTDPQAKGSAPLAGRTQLLSDVLDYFGIVPSGSITPVPAAADFAVSAYPNPFNPVVKISYTVNRPGRLLLKVYDVRGRLVRTLHDSHVATDGFVAWDGRDDRGGDVASGVYFTEARLNNEVRNHRVTLVK